ncbi:MAG: DUF2470 domain-containing protein [Paracoccaceae bacterium]
MPEAKDVLRPVDDEARRLGKTLIRTARHGALAVIEDGAPSASRVNVAADMDGRPVILISQLSPHFGALEADPRASLLLGEPGRGDPVAHPRVTLTGEAARLPDGAERDRVRARFLARHPKAALYVDFGDFAFWRLTPSRISLNGGYGKAYAPSPADLATEAPADLLVLEPDAVAHMNEDHRDSLDRYAAAFLHRTEAGWRLASLDPEGMDLIRGDEVARLWFDRPLASAEELRPRLVALSKKASPRAPS